MTKLLALAALLLLASAVQAAPTDPPWQARLSSGWGSDLAASGMAGLNFSARTLSPVKLANAYHNYQGLVQSGDVEIRSIVTGTGGFTMTIAYDKIAPEQAIVSSPCTIDPMPPVGGAVSMTTTVTGAQCTLGVGGCMLQERLNNVGGTSCP